MSGPMNSSIDIDFGGMYNDHVASLSHQPAQQTTPQQQPQMTSYEGYPHQQTQSLQSMQQYGRGSSVHTQFLDSQQQLQYTSMQTQPQYSTSINLPHNSNGMAYYDQCQPQHMQQQQQQQQDFGQTSPVYLVAQTVKNIDTFNFEHYATLPSITNTSLSHHITQANIRNHSSSSTGNSPSSQSPVSEEDYHDVTSSVSICSKDAKISKSNTDV